MKFNNYNLKEEIIHALNDVAYVNTTKIQELAIPAILDGKDVIGRSNTGTGKTAAFLIPILNKINVDENVLKTIIICPTRELAKQIYENVKTYGKYIRGLKSVCIYGGQNINIQTRLLKLKNHIVVGTPGRILEHIKKKNLNVKSVNMVVLDEADECLNAGFLEEISKIILSTNKDRQTLFFSATITDNVKKLSSKFLNNPLYLEVKTSGIAVYKTKKYAVDLKEALKNKATLRFLELWKDKKTLIFCNTKKKVEILYDFLLINNNFTDRKVSKLHSDILQDERNNILKAFRKSNSDILIATDVAARGIDIDGLNLVINYDIPIELEHYIHRIGRTGRNGSEGISITYVVGKESKKIKMIEEYMKEKFCYITIPTLNEIENNTKNVITKEEKIDRKSDSKDLDEVTLYFSVGKNDSIKVKDILGAITSNTVVPKEKIGTITLMDSYTLLKIDSKYVDEILVQMSNNKIKGKVFSVKVYNN